MYGVKVMASVMEYYGIMWVTLVILMAIGFYNIFKDWRGSDD